ncbi:MAG: hypothetical protein HS108_15275 [Planctomycetes bacterium]|nr:hypothetical protein [Planctomycetota bacterium]MCL4730472.1 hypothetical protein [Planctomycetota bacterium]
MTTVSGLKPPTGNTRRESRPSVRSALPAHLIILVLAVVLWWIARDMVAVNRTLRDGATVRVMLEPELQGQWRVVPPDTMKISLDVSGPTREINKFASELETSRVFGYRYSVTAADIENLTPNARQQVTMQLDLRKLERAGDSGAPAELTIKPVAGERTYQITLEQFIVRQAVVDLQGGVSGRIEGYSFTQRVQQDFDIEVFGPAGGVDAITNRGGRAVLSVASFDINTVLANKSRLEGKSIETLLRQGSLVANLQLVPVEGLVIRRRGQSVTVAEVPVEFTFAELQDWAKVSGDLPVSVMLPNWLAQKKSLAMNVEKSLPVELEVLSSQRENFPSALRVVIDISQIKEADQTIEAPAGGGPGPRRLKLTNIYYALLITPRDRLTVKPFSNPKVTLDTYLPVELEISWVE